MKTNLCTELERKFVCMEQFCDLFFQLMKHGTNTLHVSVYIFVHCK
jgi:hypothetical protein